VPVDRVAAARRREVPDPADDRRRLILLSGDRLVRHFLISHAAPQNHI
jgi:hypothetical protein